MHILLTDLLTCPRCGPDFGLILQADRIKERNVLEGRLGCANCRGTYPIRAAVADLRHDIVPPLEMGEGIDAPRAGADDGAAGEGDAVDRGFRAAALLGVQPENASILVVERAIVHAPDVAAILTGTHVVAGSAKPLPAATETGSGRGDAGTMSAVLHGRRLPFHDRSFRGAALLGTPSPKLVEEVGRVLIPGARMIVDRADSDTVPALLERGFGLLLNEDAVVVAAAPGRR